MSTELRVPKENVNDQTAIIVCWLVGDGEPIEAGQPALELEMSKAVFELEAKTSGILVHDYQLGQEVPIGECVARVFSADEFEAHRQQQTRVSGPPAADNLNTVDEERQALPVDIEPSGPTIDTRGPLRATPAARRLAAERGIDLAGIATKGVIRLKDVLPHEATSRAAAPSTARQTKIPRPDDLLDKWQVLDSPGPAASGFLLYSSAFMRRMLSGGYGASRRPSLIARLLLPFVMSLVALTQLAVWILAKVPIAGTCIEIIARIYKRNMFGFLLRGAYYKAKLGKLGQDSIIDQNVEIWGDGNVRIGNGCHLDMYARLAAGEASQSQTGTIDVGDHVHIGPQTQLAGRGGITIGSYTAITAGTKIFSATNIGDSPDNPYDLLPMSHAAPLDRQRVFEAPVSIGDHVFVGLNVCILPGITIGRGAIVNSGTVVTRDVPEFAIVGGNPARVQGYRLPRISGRMESRGEDTANT
jgi:acetyltransferase-like isoleucine patch superfamily enzyme